jgi:hypothetical protein
VAAHARDHGPDAGHPGLAHLAQGTVCKILAAHDVKPHKVRYYLERRDPEFEPKMAELLCVYREVATRRATGGVDEAAIAVVSYDEKPGIQAMGPTAPDRPPVPGAHPTIARDHEDKRHGTVTLMAGIDLLTGQVHALVRDRHRSREFIEFLGFFDMAYPTATAVKIILDNHSAHISRETKARDPKGASSSSSPPSTDRGSTSSRASLPKPPATRGCGRKNENDLAALALLLIGGCDMDSAYYFREKAARCRLLLAVATKPEVKEQLRLWESEFEDRADSVQRRGQRRQRMRAGRRISQKLGASAT